MTRRGPRPSKPLPNVFRYGLGLLLAAGAVNGLLGRVPDRLSPHAAGTDTTTSPHVERTEMLTYVVGYGLALALTAAAFGLVWLHLLSGRTAFYSVLGLGFVQMLVHFRCFLHIDFKRSSRADLQLLLFSAMIVALMVGGTLVVLFNLQTRMMGP